jgi:uncharacterized protein involved in outer membrane biogenesis
MTKEKSDMSPGTGKRKRRGLWWKIPLGLLAILIVLLVIAWVRLPAIVTRIANKQLPAILQTDASLEKIELHLTKGFAAIHGLRIDQPEGFGDEPLLELKQFIARVDLGSLIGGELIVIQAVELDGLTANLIKDANGDLNITKLGPPPSTDQTDSSDPSVDPRPESKPLTITLERLAVNDVAVSYTDQAEGAVPASLALGDLGILLEDCEVHLGESTEINAKNLEITLRNIAAGLPGKIGLALLGVQLDGCRIRIEEDLTVTLNQGDVTLENIRIAQPDGFGDNALLDVPRIHLDIGQSPFVDNIVHVNRFEIESLQAHIVRNAEGILNATRLTPTSGTETKTSSDEPAPDPGSRIGIHLAALGFKDGSITYTDAALGDETPLELRIRDFNVALENLMAFLAEPPVDTSSIKLSASIDQRENPPAKLGLLANVGPAGAGVPEVNAQAQLTGLLLDTLGSMVTPATRKTVGADGIDASVSVALDVNSIDLDGQATTDQKHAYPFRVHGPWNDLTIDLGPILLGVAGRFTTGLVKNLAGGTTGAAVDLAGNMAGGAKDLGKGTMDTVGKVGGGLFGAAKSALKGDFKNAGGELKEATVGAAKEARSSIGDAGSGMKEMAKDTISTTTGGKRSMEWLEQSADRHLESMISAESALSEMPYPPPPLIEATPE